MTPVDGAPLSAAEAQALRRCVRELVALSALSAVWSRKDVGDIASSLARVLADALPAELICVRVTDGLTEGVASAGSDREPLPAKVTTEVLRAAETVADASGGIAAQRMPDPGGGEPLRVARTPMGHGADCGVAVAGSSRADFPNQMDRLVLRMAANQAAIVLQQRRSETQLRISERELSDFFDNAVIGLHWVGPAGRVLRANRAELELLGYEPEEYVGHHIAEFHSDKHVLDDILQRLFRGETLRDEPARMRCKDGSIKHVRIDSSALWQDGRFVHTRCFTRDVTEQVRAEEALRRQTERLKLLCETAAVLLSSDDPDQMLGRLLQKIGPHLGVDTCFHFMVDETGRALRLVSCVGVPAETASTFARLEFGQDICGNVALRGRAIVASRIQQSDEPMVQLARSLGLRAYACHPLMAGDVLMGTLSFASRTMDVFEDDDLVFLETMCQYVARAQERRRLLGRIASPRPS